MSSNEKATAASSSAESGSTAIPAGPSRRRRATGAISAATLRQRREAPFLAAANTEQRREAHLLAAATDLDARTTLRAVVFGLRAIQARKDRELLEAEGTSLGITFPSPATAEG